MAFAWVAGEVYDRHTPESQKGNPVQDGGTTMPTYITFAR